MIHNPSIYIQTYYMYYVQFFRQNHLFPRPSAGPLPTGHRGHRTAVISRTMYSVRLICAKARIRSLNQSSQASGGPDFVAKIPWKWWEMVGKSPRNAGKIVETHMNNIGYVKIMENTWENNGQNMGTALEHMGKSWGSHLPV